MARTLTSGRKYFGILWKSFLILLLIFAVGVAGFGYWYVVMRGHSVRELCQVFSHPGELPRQAKALLITLLNEMEIARPLSKIEFPPPQLGPLSRTCLDEPIAQPTQPILVVLDDGTSSNALGRYLGEILLTQGLNEFQMAALSSISLEFLEGFDLVILNKASLRPSQVMLFEQYVANGGTLIALKPDKELASLCGLTSTTDTLSEGYIRLAGGLPGSEPLAAEPVQFHGDADVYRLSGAEGIASFCAGPDGPVVAPAVTRYHHQQGVSVCFAYDLVVSTVCMRQGNPSLASKETTGVRGIRRKDVFCDYISPGCDRIPQADIHLQLLSNLVLELTACRKPLPRWYPLPGGAKALLIMTGDGEWFPKVEDLRREIDEVEEFGGRVTLYLMHATDAQPEDAALWQSRGHSTSIHPDFFGGESSAEKVIRHDAAAYRLRFGLWPRTVRTHCLSWVGYSEQARIYDRVGIRMDLSYVSFPSPGTYMCGSAFPMRFADPIDGSITNVYQQPTQLEDDILLEKKGYTTAQATERSVELMRQSIERFHEPIVMNVHPPYYCSASGWSSRDWARATMAYATENAVPIYSAEQWLDFWEAREEARFENIRFRDGILSFDVRSLHPIKGITLMLPLKSCGKVLGGLRLDKKDLGYWVESVWGRRYALATVGLKSGTAVQIDASYR